MPQNYFTRLRDNTSSRMWVNNPIVEEMKLARESGCFACTTNPTYASNLLKRDPQYARKVIQDCLKNDGPTSKVADMVQQTMVSRIMENFQNHYESTDGQEGFVSIQGNPRLDEDAENIINESRRYKELGQNFIAKIPATSAGFKAIEVLLAENTPIIVTEVFGLPQMIEAGELYRKVSENTGYKPAYFVTHITGIYDEYLAEKVQSEGTRISSEALSAAGLAVARHQYHVFHQRGYEGVLLGGGARAIKHFTGLTGGDMHVTINWSTAQEIIELNPPMETTIEEETPNHIIDELLEKVPDFRAAWLEDGMQLEHFAGFGPVQHFRNMFIKGWDDLEAAIDEIRKAG